MKRFVVRILFSYIFIFFVLFTALYLIMPFSFNNYGLISLLNTVVGFAIIVISSIVLIKKALHEPKTVKDCDIIYFTCKRIPIILYIVNIYLPLIIALIFKDKTARVLSYLTIFSSTVFYTFSKNYFKEILVFSEQNFRAESVSVINTNSFYKDIPANLNLILKTVPLFIFTILLSLSFYPLTMAGVTYIISLLLVSILSLIYISFDFYKSINKLSADDTNEIYYDEFNGLAFKINATKQAYDNQISELQEAQLLELEKERLATIEVIRRTVDAKDTYTRGHSDRVSEYSILLGKNIGLPEDDLKMLEIGGLFHDIGKIGIPDSILLKEGKLTDEEYDEIKKHPTIGAHIIENSSVFESIVPMVLHHHEKYDGTGYPYGLKGDTIPLHARIIAIADTFDAMTSKRSYRDSLPLEVVKKELTKFSGKQFDPKLAEAFLNILETQYDQIEEIMKL